MIRILYLDSKGNVQEDYPLEKVPQALKESGTRFWMDIENEEPEKVIQILTGYFNFHPLAVEDAVIEKNLPKIDDWGDYIYICVHALQIPENENDIDPDRREKVDIFKSRNFLVTHHECSIPAINREWKACLGKKGHIKTGDDYRILYHILDGMADDCMMLMEKLDEIIDRIEDQIFDDPTNEMLSGIFKIKKMILYLRRVLSPQREVLNKLARDFYECVDSQNKIYYRDVYDHLVRLYEINESLRDLVSGALEMYLTVNSNKTNDIVKVLTVVTTIFVPLTFICGFWGMNFYEPAPNTTWCNPNIMYATIILMILLPLGMIWWMKSRKWL